MKARTHSRLLAHLGRLLELELEPPRGVLAAVARPLNAEPAPTAEADA